ncbi:unnamed protein product [Prorocentrum cordatum]|uniref:Uncharacterized protein n=1 Tax=Prorocentrum cordatum TaxID=2364126 RepID=A0ABN9TFB8_9DINO|nr:unnamed protein product [Polarella glacialis]
MIGDRRKKYTKISSMVEAQDVAPFQLAVGNIIRLHFDGLQRRPVKKKKPCPEANARKPRKSKAQKRAEKKAKLEAVKASLCLTCSMVCAQVIGADARYVMIVVRSVC